MSPFLRSRYFFVFVLAVALCAGAYVRLAGLGERPMHGDEANQAVKTGLLLETGRYVYDPHDHHGPTLYYGAAAIAKLRGQDTLAETDEWTFRLFAVVFGLGVIALVMPLADGLGRGGAAVAAVLLALSPAFVYYSRYFIQEMSLVFFTGLLIAAGWRYIRVHTVHPHLPAPTPHSIRRWRWALAAGLAAGLMHATKETCVLAFAAMAAAVPATIAWDARRDKAPVPRPQRWMVWQAGAAIVLAVVLSATLFSAFFTHGRGPLDSVLTYFNYLKRAEGAGMHDKPWYYYLQVLLYWKRGLGAPWSEAPVLVLALIGAVFALAGRSTAERPLTLARFIVFYTVFLTVIYAVIPYKTPWSMLSFYFGMVLLAGFGVAALWQAGRGRATVASPLRIATVAATAAAISYLAWGSHRANVLFPADTRNPYVYAHTSSAFLRLADRLEGLAAVSPEGHDLFIAVVEPTGDYWPIPYHTRRFGTVGYYAELPEGAAPDVIIAPNRMAQDLHNRLTGYTVESHSLRPGRLLSVFIKEELWAAYMATRQ